MEDTVNGITMDECESEGDKIIYLVKKSTKNKITLQKNNKCQKKNNDRIFRIGKIFQKNRKKKMGKYESKNHNIY